MDKDKEEKNGCCKDEYKLVKLAVDQKSTENNLLFTHVSLPADLPAKVYYEGYILVEMKKVAPHFIHGPPEGKKIANYLRYCNFRI